MNSPTEAVWSALSDHFLDTETRAYLPRTAWVCVKSGFPWETIARMLSEEVAPIVAPNLLDIAGDWAGFPDDWLFAQIRAHGDRGATPISARILAEMAPLWECLRQLFVHLSSGSVDELPVLQALSDLALERHWRRSHRLFEHLKVLIARPWPEVCAAQRLIQRVYRPLLVHEGDPSSAEARRSWDWLEQFYLWAQQSPYRHALGLCANLHYLFQDGDLSEHARVLDMRKGPADLRTCLEGPLSLLYEQPELGLRNWDRYVGL